MAVVVSAASQYRAAGPDYGKLVESLVFGT
jgi:hypothetical protein